MTRENKLALIVSFALILVVGVMVSDHLSKARDIELDGVDGQQIAQRPQPTSEVTDPTSRAIAAAQNRSQPAPAEERSTFLPEQVADTSDHVIDEPRSGELPSGQIAMGEASDPLAELRRQAALKGFTLENVRDSQPAAMMNTTPTEINQSAPRRDRSNESRSQTPGITHVVAEGDSLWRLAERYLGNGNRWKEIEAANRDVIGSDGGIGEGDRLLIPGVTAPNSTPARTQAASNTPASLGGSKQYTVKSNDTLGEIAMRECGSVRYMDEILALNDDLDNPNEIRSGMRITLPAGE